MNVIGVKFTQAGKIYYFDPNGKTVTADDRVIVETSRGVEMGIVAFGNTDIDKSEFDKPIKPIIRIATDMDLKTYEDNKTKAAKAFDVAAEKIRQHKLDMKLVDVEYTFDRSKILFYFTSDGRVDFRELVKSLAGTFRARIELRQIGVRDQAKHMGGYGICGCGLCCNKFLDDFYPVSIKMAKEQGLSLNSQKISGVCGRLMCCLQYEQGTYEELGKGLPRHGAVVKTPDGVGMVVDVNTLKQSLRVRLDKDDTGFRVYPASEISVIKAAAPEREDNSGRNGKRCKSCKSGNEPGNKTVEPVSEPDDSL